MRDYLLFQLWGPLQAWGGIAVGEVRNTERFPGKAAVLGLVAGALGIRRHEEDLLARMHVAYGYAARADGQATNLRDYHTAATHKHVKTRQRAKTRKEEIEYHYKDIEAGNKFHTIPSSRDYLQDAAFTVCLWVRDAPPRSLEDLREALRRPRFVPFLGRKCCSPGLPFHPVIVQCQDLAEALAAYEPAREFLDRIVPAPGGNVEVVWEGESSLDHRWSLPRRDELLSSRRRLFRERQQHEGTTTLP